ncbi:hypothetical protein HYU07_07670 [Candidatus Woesearchaeota archaeon]|nr:hypothetical protein [Candidatus Woesearchaeota archaeon]
MFGLTRWEKFRSHVSFSRLPLNREQLRTVFHFIQYFKITSKRQLIEELKKPIGRSIDIGDPPNEPYDKPRWDYYRFIVNVVEKHLPEVN